MTIFEKGHKVNFVDKKNTLVGYDMSGQCCEWFGWYITDNPKYDIKEGDSIIEKDDGYDDFWFDTNWFSQTYIEYTSFAVFKLKGPNREEKYLHLFNCHNGYYSHGFEMEISKEIAHKGYL